MREGEREAWNNSIVRLFLLTLTLLTRKKIRESLAVLCSCNSKERTMMLMMMMIQGACIHAMHVISWNFWL